VKIRLTTLLLGLIILIAPTMASAGMEKTRKVGWGPRTSKAAARLVDRSRWEPRPENRRANHRRPGKKMLRAWRKRSEMPYRHKVDGRFRGTTDEIIQWAAHKWGINTEIMRAVATVETWWVNSFVGDQGDSFGLYQVRRPYHCFGKCRIARYFTAFNADYYGGIIRSYYDGKQRWLNTVGGNGRKYRKGDLWGSLGAWYSGRWWPEGVEVYLDAVKLRRDEKTWKQPFFVGK
jgi:hypothetical protein